MAKFTTSATMLLTGFTVVFSVLVFLIIVIYVYGNAVYKTQNKKKAKKAAELAQNSEPQASAQVVAPVTAVSNDEIPQEIIAVISAAVDSMYSLPDSKVRIKNIKKSAGRSSWANAGVLNNTRPF